MGNEPSPATMPVPLGTTPDQAAANGRASSKRPDPTVVILGAGIAGLAAAYELEQLGIPVEVLEGSRRLGGRICTFRFGDSADAPFAELGAMRIPAAHSNTLRYVARLGLTEELRSFDSLLADKNAFLRTAEKYIRLGDAACQLITEIREGLSRDSYRPESLMFGAWLTLVVDAIAPPDQRQDLRQDLRTRLLDHVDSLNLTPFVRENGNAFDLHGVFAAHPSLREACRDPLRGFLDDILMETSTELFRLRGGMDQLIRRLARRVHGPIRRQHQVVGVDVGSDEVVVHLRAEGRPVVRRCGQVLCTLPFSVLRGLRLSGFSDEKLQIINGVQYVPATKVALHCREAFWQREGIKSGASLSGGRVRQTYYPPIDGDPAYGAVLLASYSIGEDAELLGRMSAAARYAAVLADLAPMHPQLLRPGMVLNAKSLAWGQHPWSHGACSVRWGMDAAAAEEQRVRAQRPEGRLYFAGEHCSSRPAWLEGALESALDAVSQMVMRMAAAFPAPSLMRAAPLVPRPVDRAGRTGLPVGTELAG
ncbi:flavin monoamine oxidase family protein [Actinoplanes siamensis]|uniref:Flavin monoamine oxidase n=1 Tax=Actinoplanes siamensis TaxID=1223317 RepID=A0A919NCT1_9ACTN|nr:NAD(P)/FAD-dependent oxidoreductase [Actinoplanes siamensis]GIF08506.1 flavin monoamine oxidase [Actinoplanes siamensis]